MFIFNADTLLSIAKKLSSDIYNDLVHNNIENGYKYCRSASFDYEIIGSLLYQSLITASFGFIVWNSLLQRYGAVALHSFIFIMPVAGVLLGGLVLDEPITINIITALLLIVTGILTIHYRQKKQIPSYPLSRNI